MSLDRDEQTRRFAQELEKLIDYYKQEYEMTYATIVGTLHIACHALTEEARNLEDEEED
jgi:hypothetical protein